MVQFAESCFTWNTRFVCVDCLETTWLPDQRIPMRAWEEQATGFNPAIRWWTCKECWQ